jgi:hypothetical protein
MTQWGMGGDAAFAVIQKLVGSTRNRPVTFTANRKNRQVYGQNQGQKWPQKCHETEASQSVIFFDIIHRQ